MQPGDFEYSKRRRPTDPERCIIALGTFEPGSSQLQECKDAFTATLAEKLAELGLEGVACHLETHRKSGSPQVTVTAKITWLPLPGMEQSLLRLEHFLRQSNRGFEGIEL